MTKESKSIEVLKRKREQSSREVENEKKKKKNGKKNQEWKFPPIYDVYIGLGQFPQQGRIHDVPCRMRGGDKGSEKVGPSNIYLYRVSYAGNTRKCLNALKSKVLQINGRTDQPTDVPTIQRMYRLTLRVMESRTRDEKLSVRKRERERRLRK